MMQVRKNRKHDIYIYIYIYNIYIYIVFPVLDIYIYYILYIYREREREREIDGGCPVRFEHGFLMIFLGKNKCPLLTHRRFKR